MCRVGVPHRVERQTGGAVFSLLLLPPEGEEGGAGGGEEILLLVFPVQWRFVLLRPPLYDGTIDRFYSTYTAVNANQKTRESVCWRWAKGKGVVHCHVLNEE